MALDKEADGTAPAMNKAASTSGPVPGKPKRFRFKTVSTRSEEGDHFADASKRKRRHHHSSNYARKRSRTSPSGIDDPSIYDDSVSNLPPESAFRESLFDALGDDEGAAFWEGVYGQPIHTYPNTYQDEETGELEQMTEDEYAQFVRRKMWEKSSEGIEAAKEEKRRKRAHEKLKIREEEQKSAPMASSFGYAFDFMVDESLKRGDQRKEKRRWKRLWEDYLRQWDDLQKLAADRKGDSSEAEQLLRSKIPWPVESGKREDVNIEEIQRFISNGTKHVDGREDFGGRLMNALKLERVRWHPDKIQQRYGFMEIDVDTMQGITAVFQALDRMWNDGREKK